MRVLVSLACAFAFFFWFAMGAEAQRFLRPARPCPPTGCPIVTGPSSASLPAEMPAREPSWQTLETDDSQSPPPATVLEALPGTGSKSPTGLLSPKVTHSLDPATMHEIRELFKAKLGPQTVPITLPMEAGTSERLSRILMILEACVWLAGGMLGISGAGKLSPLAVLLGNGLRSVLPAPLPPSALTPAAPSSPGVNP